jgi:hypothetical protein
MEVFVFLFSSMKEKQRILAKIINAILNDEKVK